MTPESVLNEWFGEAHERDNPPPEKRERWFKKDPNFDRHLERTYKEALQAAIEGRLNWEDSAAATLAEILLLDQFCRNIYRDTPRMFDGDERALKLSKRLLATEAHLQLPASWRGFVYMPLMHSEKIGDQEECVRHFEREVELAPESEKKSATEALRYARAHQDIVARFGRFPHRNRVLSRTSTDAEIDFLRQPGSSF
jgi:uncharacterized protein (DUF924 family)